jgi:hypothetical protein
MIIRQDLQDFFGYFYFQFPEENENAQSGVALHATP